MTRYRFDPRDAPERLSAAGDAIDATLAAQDASERARFGARLVCEELVLNAFEHGRACFVVVEVDLSAAPRRLTFVDDGIDFDAGHSRPTPEPATAEEVPPRGRGLLLVRRFARGITHRRENEQNRTTVILAD